MVITFCIIHVIPNMRAIHISSDDRCLAVGIPRQLREISVIVFCCHSSTNDSTCICSRTVHRCKWCEACDRLPWKPWRAIMCMCGGSLKFCLFHSPVSMASVMASFNSRVFQYSLLHSDFWKLMCLLYFQRRRRLQLEITPNGILRCVIFFV